MQKSILAAALLFAALVGSQSAMAWDDTGHKVVALIADQYLSPEAREKVHAMLDADSDSLTGHDIASAATWADKYLESDAGTTKDHYNRTYNWHMVEMQATRPNIPKSCFGQPPLPQGVVASQGPAHDCVIDKINQFAGELADPRTAADERLIALKFLLNLVAEVHQPLNVVDEGNAHGKKALIRAKGISPGDLYGYWNSAFVHRLGTDPDQIAQQLIAQITPANKQQWENGAPQLWALEAHRLGVDRAYGMLGSVDDRGNFVLEDAYVGNATKIVGTQLSRAGIRLAFLLNDALGKTPGGSVPSKPKRGNAIAGREFARVVCGVCHVTVGEQPDPSSSASAPDFQAVANTRGMSDAALQSFLFGSHPSMPDIKLSQRQADNLIAYILSLRTAP